MLNGRWPRNYTHPHMLIRSMVVMIPWLSLLPRKSATPLLSARPPGAHCRLRGCSSPAAPPPAAAHPWPALVTRHQVGGVMVLSTPHQPASWVPSTIPLSILLLSTFSSMFCLMPCSMPNWPTGSKQLYNNNRYLVVLVCRGEDGRGGW